MTQEDQQRISNTYESLRAETINDIRKIYTQIQRELTGIEVMHTAGALAKKESERLNSYITQLTYKVKQASMEEMVKCGCKEYLTEMGWTEMMEKVKLPVVELCKVNMVSPPRKENASAENMNLKKKLDDLMLRRNISIGAASAGTAMAAVSIIVPGWNAIEIASCVTGSVLIIAGGVSAISAENNIQEINKFTQTRTDAPRRSNVSVNELLGKLTNAQFKCNSRIICQWLTSVKTELIAECDKLLAW